MAISPLDPHSPPAWAIEDVHVEPYNSNWPEQAATYAYELTMVLSRWLLCPIEHVGSTALPGIAAKPVIDLMAQVEDKDVVMAQAGDVLDDLDWKHVPPEFDGRHWRHFFAKTSGDGKHRLAHLHVMSEGASRWGQQLDFRDALRTDPVIRDEYAQLKTELASRFADNREAYTDEKAKFVTRIMRELDTAD